MADALSLYLRAIMALNEETRSRIFHPDRIYEHLKIQCRKEGNPLEHIPFGEELFEIMKTVGLSWRESLCCYSYVDILRWLFGSCGF